MRYHHQVNTGALEQCKLQSRSKRNQGCLFRNVTVSTFGLQFADYKRKTAAPLFWGFVKGPLTQKTKELYLEETQLSKPIYLPYRLATTSTKTQIKMFLLVTNKVTLNSSKSTRLCHESPLKNYQSFTYCLRKIYKLQVVVGLHSELVNIQIFPSPRSLAELEKKATKTQLARIVKPSVNVCGNYVIKVLTILTKVYFSIFRVVISRLIHLLVST